MRVLCIALLCAGSLFSAPIPYAKPVQKKTHREMLIGQHSMLWGYGRGSAVFCKDGYYACRWCDCNYTGQWTLHENKLKVLERWQIPDGAPGETLIWEVNLIPDKLKGKAVLNGGSSNLDFSLDKEEETK